MASERLGWWQVSAVAAGVPRLRHLVLGAIRGRGFDGDAVGLAVTEAATNVVRHAYPDAEGDITLSVEASAVELVVVVADQGIGARSFFLGSESGLGLGLALIRELCAGMTVEPTSQGTTVTMRFSTQGPAGVAPPARAGRE